MAKKSNYVFPIERNTALEVVKIVKNFYLLEGASGEELLAKRSGLSTRLLLTGVGESAVTQELLNNIYANLNNEEALVGIVKESFQSIDYESALFLLRWTKDSQSPYYPRGMGEKPVEQFNEDYEFAKNLFIAYINDHGLISIKNLPGRVVRVQKDIVKEMANNYRSVAVDEARQALTTNQEALVELRNSIKEQKQKIADLKAADENSNTIELEAKLKDDRHKAMELYKIVKGQRRSLRDTLEERAILDRDFADVVGGKTINKSQFDAEREEDDEKSELIKKVLEIAKKNPETLANPQQALAIVAMNIKGMYNESEVKELLGESQEDATAYTPAQSTETYAETEATTETTNTTETNDDITTDSGITPNDTAVQPEVANTEATVINTAPQQQVIDNNINTIPQAEMIAQNVAQGPTQQVVTETADATNGQNVFNAIYNEALAETEQQEQANINPNNTDPNNADPNNANV